MKLENDPENFNPSPPRKSYNPFDSDDDALDSPGLMSENMYVKENLNGFDLRAFEKSSDTVLFHVDNGEFLWEEDVLGQPTTGDHHAVNSNSNVNTGLFEKEGQPYTDKNVTECELPEFVICYKESSTVKDIGIDENSSAFLDLSSKTNDDMKIEEGNDQIGVLEAPKSVNLDGLNEEAITGQYLVHEFGDDDLLKITELTLDIEDRGLPGNGPTAVAEILTKGSLVSDVQDHKETERSTCKHDEPDKNELNHDNDAMKKKGLETSQREANNVVVIQDPATTQSPSKLSTEYGVEAMAKESPIKEETLISDDAHDSDKLAYNSKVESRSITFDFGSTTNSKPEKQEDEPAEKAEVAKPPSAQTMTRQEEEKQEVISGSSILLARLEDRVHGETSFSAGMPVPLPSLITYSGSISLRSESSAGTGSTRSFAFPVLQTDWNSSPARMGKAGQWHVKKHRGWAFSCCKF